MAVEEASFSTSTDTMSLGLMKSMALLNWSPVDWGSSTPSTTYSGLLDELMELNPRILTVVRPPGRPELLLTCTPGILPAIIWLSEGAGRSISSASFTPDTDPVKSDLRTVP